MGDDKHASHWAGYQDSPRGRWRQAQIMARKYDRSYPSWWENNEQTMEFLSHLTPRYRRLWVQLIRQRKGF